MASSTVNKWILLGWSFGGLVAMEMAKLLGNKIISVYLLDTINPTGIIDQLEQASPVGENIAAIHRPILSWHLALSRSYQFVDPQVPVILIKARPDVKFTTELKRRLYFNNWNLSNLITEWLDIGHYQMMDPNSGIMDLLNLLLNSASMEL